MLGGVGRVEEEVVVGRYVISFDDGAMVVADGELEAVSAATMAVVREAQGAGVWVFGGGLGSQPTAVVGVDGAVSDGPIPAGKAVLGGFCIVDVASRGEALEWAGKFAAACRCAQEVREFLPGSETAGGLQ
ncbi:YciI family protein [Streptomyces sp. NPDC047014]|uniref:YciI family protein n=1 Tax=Streptomyces sp. NPDC047014 TaxID=3155736 RepID=UPI0033DE3CC4